MYRIFTHVFIKCQSICSSVDNWLGKMIQLHNCFLFTPVIMKLHILTPYEWGTCPSAFRSKNQRWRSQCNDNRKWQGKVKLFRCITAFLLKYHYETSHKDSPWVEDVPYWFLGQQVTGQGHNALITENGLAWHSQNYEWLTWSICNGCGMSAGNAYPSGHLVPSTFLGRGYTPIIETSYPELCWVFFSTFHLEYSFVLSPFCFMLHNCFPFTYIIMKLQTKTWV